MTTVSSRVAPPFNYDRNALTAVGLLQDSHFLPVEPSVLDLIIAGKDERIDRRSLRKNRAGGGAQHRAEIQELAARGEDDETA